MIHDAIEYYHELLSNRHLDSTIERLQSCEQKLSIAGRPVCTVLRPYFIPSGLYAEIKAASDLVMRGISTLCHVLMENPDFRKQLDLSPAEEKIIHVNTGYGSPAVSSRLDGFLSGDGVLRFVEYNSDSPGGIGYGDVLGEVFASMPIATEFAQRYPFRMVPARKFVFDSLLTAYHRWGGKGLPSIGIIDWKEAPTFSEFLLFQEFFEKHGCRVKIGDPRELEYRDGKLYLHDFAIELVYKRLVVGEMLERLGTENTLVQAARDGAVCVANGFGVQLAFRKILFALLSEPVHSNMFDPAVRKAIQRHIPWTRRVRAGRTDYAGRTVDLLAFIRENRERLVIKPAGEYGGRGVVLGWQSTPQIWETTIDQALTAAYVIQERVPVGSEPYPSLQDGKLTFTQRYFDLDPYVWNGEQIEGCGVRLSQSPLLNVSAGGGSATPLFILL